MKEQYFNSYLELVEILEQMRCIIKWQNIRICGANTQDNTGYKYLKQLLYWTIGTLDIVTATIQTSVVFIND